MKRETMFVRSTYLSNSSFVIRHEHETLAIGSTEIQQNLFLLERKSVTSLNNLQTKDKRG